MSKLRISDQLLLPKDTVTSTLIVYGGKGMGKTNFGAVLVEELSKLNLRWCALDPLGVWWGLRYSQDGKSAGVECLILGGSHADFPIEPTGGAVVADMVIEEPANFIIDFSRKPSGEMWSIGEKIRFITDYAYRLFQRQGELIGGVRREPIFQLLDEAARYIPQIIPAGNPQLAMCVAAWEQLVEEGRNIGIGVGLLTQRSARMNKSVSEVADAILSFRIVGPNSIGAIMDWLGEHVPKERIKTMIEEVRSLERGSCLVVSPGWLQFEGVIKIRERQTFDSSATPKPGERARRVSGEGAKPDLDKYAARMQATIERTKENDPKTLKAQIAQLRKELAAKPDQKVPIGTKVDQKPIEKAVAIATRELRKALGDAMKIVAKIVAVGFEGSAVTKEEVEKALQAASAQIVKSAEAKFSARSVEFARLQREATATLERMKTLLADESLAIDLTVKRQEPFTVKPISVPPRTASPRAPVNGDGELSGPERKILRALGELLSIGKEAPSKNMVAAWASYSPIGGAFGNPIGSLRSKGLIDYPQPGMVTLTDAGRAQVGPCDAPDQEEIWRRIEATCTGPEQKILRALLDNAGTEEISKNDLAEKANYSPIGGAFGNPIGALRTKGLLDYPRQGVVKAADWLFL